MGGPPLDLRADRRFTVGRANTIVFVEVQNAYDGDPQQLGQSVTFTATVTPAGTTGTVEFYDGAILIGSSGAERVHRGGRRTPAGVADGSRLRA